MQILGMQRSIIVVASGLLFATMGFHAPASAGSADNCCADIEARIAELEETTARKGNRKVSLTISGWVNEAIFAWDDGTVSDVYVGTNQVEQSRFRFVGDAKIDKDWSAGYIIEVGVQGHPSNQWNQDGISSRSLSPLSREYALNLRKSNWYFKSKTYGQFAIGLNAMATYHLLDDADPTLTRNVNDVEGAGVFMSAFRLRSNGQYIGTLKWTDAMRGIANSTPGDGLRRDVFRYDTPVWHGFSAAASVGENYVGDLMANYKGDIGDFLLVVRGGYGWSNDPGSMQTGADGSIVVGGTPCISGSTTLTSEPNFHCRWGGVASTIMHNPTGLFLYGGWGQITMTTDHVFPAGTIFSPTSNVFFLQPGIERKWFSLGKTNIFGEYRHDDDGSNPGKTVSASLDFWQGGVVQKIDAADTTLYLVYQHSSGSIVGNDVTAKAKAAPVGKTELDGFQEIIAGAKVNF